MLIHKLLGTHSSVLTTEVSSFQGVGFHCIQKCVISEEWNRGVPLTLQTIAFSFTFSLVVATSRVYYSILQFITVINSGKYFSE